ncbi:cysteine hydrolase family protein [Modicisalibacter zincidurans]|uniref:Isochorismatase-like domain-containing protein n=1 Tax=Modicisalibacter zincidurans TaxID=1178777 RepID=A0ABP9RI30_9GAMM|nr:isochorismatase family cysteine hydrolase [Halomonas zincidurans]
MEIKKTALLLIDLQKEEGTSDVVGLEDIIKGTKALEKTCRELGIPVIYTRHINRSDGIGLANNEPVKEAGNPIYYNSHTKAVEILDELSPAKNDIVIDKYRYSGFFGSNLDAVLQELGVEHLMVGGVLTDVCVLSTVLDAYSRDYQVNIVNDICGATTEGAHMAAILIMANWIYDIRVWESIQLKNMLLGKEHYVWESHVPDELSFTPESMRDAFDKIQQAIGR